MTVESHGVKFARRSCIVLLVLLTGPLLMTSCGNLHLNSDWRSADRSSTNQAPDPGITREAVVQVYVARAFNWRGIFAVHSWIAVKPAQAEQYTVYQVMGWRQYRQQPVVIADIDVPDRAWYGARPKIIAQLHGAQG